MFYLLVSYFISADRFIFIHANGRVLYINVMPERRLFVCLDTSGITYHVWILYDAIIFIL